MPQRRSPKTLREVSHLFLSTGRAEAVRAHPGSFAAVWLAVIAPGENRAFLAAGLAAAFVGHGVRVTLVEIARGLPTVGYYFGLEPSEYLAPICGRRTPLAGSWGDSIRYLSARESALLPLVGALPQRDGKPAALVAAFDHPEGSLDPSFASDLRRRLDPGGGGGSGGGAPPDCVVIVSRDPRTGAEFADSLEAIAPAPVTLVAAPEGAAPAWERSGAGGAGKTFERFVVPRSLRASWARRVPPSDPLFHDLASSALQMLSLERRRNARGAARR